MLSVKQWVERCRQHRSRNIKKEINQLQRDFDAEQRWRRKDPDIENWDEEFEREILADRIKAVVDSYPEVRYKPRTWVWFLRWGLSILCAYIGIAFLIHALRHSEMTETQRFLDFWNALLLR